MRKNENESDVRLEDLKKACGEEVARAQEEVE